MFFKKERNNQNYNQNPFQENINPNSLYPGYHNNMHQDNYQDNRLIFEIKENRRRINNLAKRIVRLENYLRIRDTSDYSILEEEDPEYYDPAWNNVPKDPNQGNYNNTKR